MANILIIEDDRQIVENLSYLLISEGYKVLSASGKNEGIEKFRKSNIDCVLLDLSLSDGNGFSVCSEIKSISEVPVIFLTASADEGCTVAGFEVGADDYIIKPFRPRELIARIKNAMRKKQKNPSLIQCRDICVDSARAVVTKNGEEIFLSALEYRLLLIFFTNKEQLLSRDRIADELWAFSGEFVSDNTLNVYIKRLREKIEDDPQKPRVIQTIRGLGYKAVDDES